MLTTKTAVSSKRSKRLRSRFSRSCLQVRIVSRMTARALPGNDSSNDANQLSSSVIRNRVESRRNNVLHCDHNNAGVTPRRRRASGCRRSRRPSWPSRTGSVTEPVPSAYRSPPTSAIRGSGSSASCGPQRRAGAGRLHRRNPRLSCERTTHARNNKESIIDCTTGWRPICIEEELPGVAAHDTLLVLLRPAVAVPSHARGQTYPTQQNKQRIVRGYSWQLLLSADWPWRRNALAPST